MTSGASSSSPKDDGYPAGVIRFQLEDELFLARSSGRGGSLRAPPRGAAGVQGQGVSNALLEWAVRRTRASGDAALLRLDCDADRPKLRALYESCGFRLHSYRQVGPYWRGADPT